MSPTRRKVNALVEELKVGLEPMNKEHLPVQGGPVPIAQAPAEGGASRKGRQGWVTSVATVQLNQRRKKRVNRGGGGPRRRRMSLGQEQPVHTSVERLGIWFLTRGGEPTRR